MHDDYHDDQPEVYYASDLEALGLEALGLVKLADKNDINRSLIRATVVALMKFKGRGLEQRDLPDIASLYGALKEEFEFVYDAVDRAHPMTVTMKPKKKSAE